MHREISFWNFWDFCALVSHNYDTTGPRDPGAQIQKFWNARTNLNFKEKNFYPL